MCAECCYSVTKSRPTLCDPTDCSTPVFPESKLCPRVCSDSYPLSWWCYLTISSSVHPPFLPSVFPNIRVFSNESAPCIRWPKYWSFNISPSNEYSGLISFRIGCFDLLAVWETLKSLFQHHSLKPLILQCSALFIGQLSHLCITGKSIALIMKTLTKWCLCFLIYCLGLS